VLRRSQVQPIDLIQPGHFAEAGTDGWDDTKPLGEWYSAFLSDHVDVDNGHQRLRRVQTIEKP
jgi:hypothetical protein